MHLRVNLHCLVNELVTFQSLRRKEGEDRTALVTGAGTSITSIFNTESSFIACASLKTSKKNTFLQHSPSPSITLKPAGGQAVGRFMVGHFFISKDP